MYSFVCFSHLNKQKYSFIIREEGRSDEACAVKSCLLEKLSSFPFLNFSLKGGVRRLERTQLLSWEYFYEN